MKMTSRYNLFQLRIQMQSYQLNNNKHGFHWQGGSISGRLGATGSGATNRMPINSIGGSSSTNGGGEVPKCQGCNDRVAQFVCAGCSSQWYCSRECQVTSTADRTHSSIIRVQYRTMMQPSVSHYTLSLWTNRIVGPLVTQRQ